MLKPDDYWAENPDYPIEDWKLEVANDDTRLGYWDWVDSLIEQKEIQREPADTASSDEST